jgi:hypothetical protein
MGDSAQESGRYSCEEARGAYRTGLTKGAGERAMRVSSPPDDFPLSSRSFSRKDSGSIQTAQRRSIGAVSIL